MWNLKDNLVRRSERLEEGPRELEPPIESEAELAKKEALRQAREGCDNLSNASNVTESAIQKKIQQALGNGMGIFLSLLALMAMVAAVITAYETAVHDFPKLWQQINEYNALQQVIQNLLLVAIAAELGLLFLFHRTTAAVEVIIFVIARKMLTPDISVTGLALCTASIIGLVIMRFYYLPGRPK